jgi:hypothetical protein
MVDAEPKRRLSVLKGLNHHIQGSAVAPKHLQRPTLRILLRTGHGLRMSRRRPSRAVGRSPVSVQMWSATPAAIARVQASRGSRRWRTGAWNRPHRFDLSPGQADRRGSATVEHVPRSTARLRRRWSDLRRRPSPCARTPPRAVRHRRSRRPRPLVRSSGDGGAIPIASRMAVSGSSGIPVRSLTCRNVSGARAVNLS